MGLFKVGDDYGKYTFLEIGGMKEAAVAVDLANRGASFRCELPFLMRVRAVDQVVSLVL